MKIKSYIIPAAVAAMLASPVWAAQQPTSGQTGGQTKSSSTLNEQQLHKDKVKVLEDAVKALEKTGLALRQLDQGKKQEALDTLALVTGKLELLVAQHPDLALAPVDVQMVAYDFVGTKDSVKKLRHEAKKLLSDGRLQDARHLLADVASEIVVRTTNLPLLTYPDAIKAVVPLISKDDVMAAKTALQNVLSTVVVTNDIIPLPVLRAQTALAEAKKITTSKTSKKEDASKQQAEANKLLDEARKQLEWAQTLGYGDKDSFEDLYHRIDDLESSLADGKHEQGLFDKLSKAIKNMF